MERDEQSSERDKEGGREGGREESCPSLTDRELRDRQRGREGGRERELSEFDRQRQKQIENIVRVCCHYSWDIPSVSKTLEISTVVPSVLLSPNVVPAITYVM